MALSGYAAAWKSAYNSNGGNSTAANVAANKATYGNSSGPTTSAQVSQALSGTNFSPGTKVTGGDGRSYTITGGGSGGSGGKSSPVTLAPYVPPAPVKPASTKTTIVLPNGQTSTGYVINGKTYVDDYGKTPVSVGTIVDTAGGKYIMTVNGGVKYNPVQMTLPGSTTKVTGYLNDKNETFTDPNLSTRVSNGTTVYGANGKQYVMSGGKEFVNNLDTSKFRSSVAPPAGFTAGVGGLIGPDGKTYDVTALAQMGITSTGVDGAGNQIWEVTDKTKYDTAINGVPQPQPEQKTYTEEDIQKYVQDYINSQQNQTTTPTTGTTGSTGTDDIWNKFMSWASPYMNRPSTEVPTYESISEQIKAQLKPLHDEQDLELQQSKGQAIKGMAANLAARGMYNSDINETKASNIYNKFDNSQALADASFQSDVGNKAQTIYLDAKNKATTSDQQYNQSMINLGLSLMNGMIDMNKFTTDDAYRKTTLATLFGDKALSYFGTAK